MRRMCLLSANERSKRGERERKRNGKKKGKRERRREIGSEALAETEKIANAPAGNRTRDPSKRGWCSTTEPPRQATVPANLFQIYLLFTTSALSNAHSWLTIFAQGTCDGRHCASRTDWRNSYWDKCEKCVLTLKLHTGDGPEARPGVPSLTQIWKIIVQMVYFSILSNFGNVNADSFLLISCLVVVFKKKNI